MDTRLHPFPEDILSAWQRSIDLVVRLTGARVGLIMRISGEDIEVFVSSTTENNPYVVGDKERLVGSGLYCEAVIASQAMLAVSDALSSERWKNNPDIKHNMVSYLGFPIRSGDGQPFGTICLLDDKANEHHRDAVELIEKMRDLIESHLKLKETAEDLEKRVQERTRELQVEIAERTAAQEALQRSEASLKARVAARTEALRVTEARWQSLLALSPDAISVVDTTGRILYCNEQFAYLHGYERTTEISGRLAIEFTTPEEYERLFSGVAARFAAGEGVARNIEIQVHRRDGTVITTEYVVGQVAWPDVPGGMAFISNIRDITGRKALEAELERHRLQLEELVQERTRELQAEIAERAAAQAALRNSEANLTAAQRLARLGSWDMDVVTGEMRWSDEMSRIFQLSSSDLLPAGAAAWQAVHPEDVDAIRTTITRLYETGERFDATYRLMFGDGEVRVVHGEAEATLDETGRPVHVHGIVQDITEQEQLKAALAKRIQELSILQQLGHLVSFNRPLEETVRIYLQRLIQCAGFEAADLYLRRGERLELAGSCSSLSGLQEPAISLAVGEGLCGLAAESGRPEYSGNIHRDLRCNPAHRHGAGVYSLAALPLHSGDSIIGILAVGSAAPDAFAGRHDFLEMLADLVAGRLQNALLYQETRERAAGLEEIVVERTRELQTERDRTQAVLETVGESVVVADLEGRVLYANPATLQLNGASRDEILGHPLWHNWSTQMYAQVWPPAQTALAGGRSWRGDVLGLRTDGTTYVAALTATPLYDESGETAQSGSVWVQRDITSVKEAERLKDRFVSNVSHELRTPISVIGLSCDNLVAYADRLAAEERRQMFQDIHEQAHVLSSLIEDILTLSQIDGGRAQRPWQELDLARLVEEQVERQRPLAEGRSQHLSVTTCPSVNVLGNAGQIQQIVRNLLDNAIKYTHPGGEIHCICETHYGVPVDALHRTPGAPDLSPRSWAVIRIVDNGIGIAPVDFPFVFERFYRVQSEGEVPGTGLGLPIARELALLHGGWIAVASAPGEGSTFTVYLPLHEEQDARQDTTQEPEE